MVNACKFGHGAYELKYDPTNNPPVQFDQNSNAPCPFRSARTGFHVSSDLKQRYGFRVKCRHFTIQELGGATGHLFAGNQNDCEDYRNNNRYEGVCFGACVSAAGVGLPNLQQCNFFDQSPDTRGEYVGATADNPANIRPCSYHAPGAAPGVGGAAIPNNGRGQLGYQQLCQRKSCNDNRCLAAPVGMFAVLAGGMGGGAQPARGHCNHLTGVCDTYPNPCLTNGNQCNGNRPTCVAIANAVASNLNANAGQCGCVHAATQINDPACNDPTDQYQSNGQLKRSICVPGIQPKGQCAGCTDGNDAGNGLDITSDNCDDRYKCNTNGVSFYGRTCQAREATALARSEYANEYLVEQERKVNALRLVELESKLKV